MDKPSGYDDTVKLTFVSFCSRRDSGQELGSQADCGINFKIIHFYQIVVKYSAYKDVILPV